VIFGFFQVVFEGLPEIGIVRGFDEFWKSFRDLRFC
jgi:hypothetical protein